jgi:NAD(P)-dependent dehydrogenase (short-subunit alcohol dehydrogenase family)
VFVAKPFTQYTDEDYDLVTGVNLGGFFHITRHAIEHMERLGSGHVVNTAVTKSLATEYAATGIRVNAVSPGVIKTPTHAPETYDDLGTLHPIGRMGETSDVVSAIMYLEPAPFVTGEFMNVDGGQSAGD